MTYEWMHSPDLRLNNFEKKCVLMCCQKLKLVCRCDEITQCGLKQNYCRLCFNILKDTCEVIVNENKRLSLLEMTLLVD